MIYKFLFHLLTIFTLSGCCLLLSCEKPPKARYSSERKQHADSILRKVEDLDALQRHLTDYRQHGNQEGVMMVTKKLGRKLRENNLFMDAVEIHMEGYDVAKELADTLEMVQALNNVATNYRRMSMLDKATAFHYQALQLCEETEDQTAFATQKNRVVSLNGIGNICLRIEDYTTADSIFRAALEGEKKLDSALGQAINYANLGSIYEALGQKDSARIYYQHSMGMNIKANSKLGISICYLHFGNLYENDGFLDLAVGEYQKAYRMEHEIDAWHWLNACISLARVYHKQGKDREALELLQKAEQEGMKCHAQDHLKDTYLLLHDIYTGQRKLDQAIEAYKKGIAYSDSILNEKKLLDVQNERIRFEIMRRQKEVDNMEKNYLTEKNTRNVLTMTIILVVPLCCLVIGLLFYSLRLKKRKQQTLLQLEDIRSSFFTNITHEFRTPLTVIIGLSERLSNNELSQEEAQGIGKTVYRQGQNLLSLINQILDISKIKTEGVQQDFQHGDIIGFIHTIVESMRELTNPKHLDLQFEAEKNQVDMDFIPDYVTKIIHNLVSNAIKFTSEDGRIYLTANIEDNHLRLCVADNGCGIPQEEVTHIFDVFFQGKSGKLAIGTGVGLSLVHQLVEAMNGTIQVYTAESEGSVFIVKLPLKQGDGKWKKLETYNPAKLLTSTVSEADKEEGFDGETDDEEDGKPVILIVEDNHDVSRYIGSVLSHSHLHYARNGKEGIEKALRVMPDVIVTDLMMPEMDGLEMCKQIRKSEILNHIPVIAITARCTEEDKIKGLKAGINTYIYKPFNSEELNLSIRTLLEQRRLLQQYTAHTTKDHANSNQESHLGLTSEEQRFLNQVVDEIYAQMAKENVNLNDLAQSLCMSLKQINRKIMSITGDTLSKYVMKIRMQRAKTLLDSDRNYTIAEVAQRCGFNENSNFTRAFKTFFDITPSQYKRLPKMEDENANPAADDLAP